MHDRDTLVDRTVAATAAKAVRSKPPSDGSEDALRVVFDPGADIAARMRAFRIAVRMVAGHRDEEEAEEREE